MTDESTYDGYEVGEPEGFLQPKRYRASYSCSECGNKWKSKWAKSIPPDTQPCPSVRCAVARETAALAQQVANLTRMLQEQRAPAQVGANIRVQAVDRTAEIVMQDNRLTDLRDNIRQGEIMAPKLPPPMQKAADNFFGGPRGAIGVSQPVTMAQKKMQALGARAIRGAFRNASVAPNLVLPSTRPQPVVMSNPGFVRR